VFVINYDEWGGFFDHVPPPIRPVSPEDVAAGNTDGRLGFRTPLLVVSPFARNRFVAHEVYDHTSILRMVEERWGLAPLSARDASTNSLANVLDFTQEPRSAPQYPVPPIAAGDACPAPTLAASASLSVPRVAAATSSRQAAWSGLREVASRNGF
jgi:phospholipase C